MMVCVVVGWFGLVACGDDNHPGNPTPVLQSLAIAPSTVSLDVGASVQLAATGTFSDGSTQDLSTQVTWTSSNNASATVSPTGSVSGIAVGNVTITASQDGTTATATVNVTGVAARTITSIAVSPVDPTIETSKTQPLTATATFSDQTTQDVTATVTWSSSDGNVATVDATGLVLAKAAGTATITAALDAVSGSTKVTVVLGAPTLVSIAVTPATSTVHVGGTQQLTATGTLSDNTTKDLTTTAAWTSSDDTIATVDAATGLVTAKAAGTATITATSGAISGAASVSVDVPLPVLLSITIDPVPAHAPAGLTLQLTATGHFDVGPDVDLTHAVAWESDAPANASVDATGLVSAHKKGTVAKITATKDGVSGSLQFAVDDPVLVGLVVTPGTATLRGTESLTFSALITFSDGSTVRPANGDLEWSSSDPAVATVSKFFGTAKAVSAGTVTITATTDGLSGTATLTVRAPSVLSTTPQDGELGVRANPHVKLAFDQAIAPASLTTQTDAGACTGSLQVSSDDFATCVGFTTAAPVLNAANNLADATPTTLTAGAVYKIRVTAAVTTAAGVAAEAFTQSLGFTVTDVDCASSLSISQVFGGGGGNKSSPFFNDFIELHNGSATAINLKDWSIQFATGTGAAWVLQNLPDVALAPGAYFLIQEGSAGTLGGAALPTPDFAPINVFQLPQASGKIALVHGHTLLTGACPIADTTDFLGYGTTNCAEGTSTAQASNTTGAVRAGNACVDTENNSADFAIGALTPPRNSASAPFACACSTH